MHVLFVLFASLENVAEQTEGLSGSDVAGVVRDALMRPVRQLQSATWFKPAPKSIQKAAKKNAGDGGSGTKTKPVMIPCKPDEPGAVSVRCTDLSPEQVIDPGLIAADVEAAAAAGRSTVSTDDIERHLEWQRQFGNEAH